MLKMIVDSVDSVDSIDNLNNIDSLDRVDRVDILNILTSCHLVFVPDHVRIQDVCFPDLRGGFCRYTSLEDSDNRTFKEAKV